MEEIMKKFKDFLYDKNDILIAVLILVVAAAIIAWRMDVILQYPKQLIHNDSQIETPTVDPSKTDDTASGDQTDNQTGSGKKGTKYFYKGQIRVYDKNGKLIAKTALKQCKYATRSWTK